MLGESPPLGRGFFYSGESTLLIHSIPVFERVLGMPGEPPRFLDAFRDRGFYLEDFVSLRGAKPGAQPEALETRAGVSRVARFIGQEKPELVVGVLTRIRGLVAEAVASSGAPDTPWLCLPFPYRKSESAQLTYRDGLAAVLAEL